MTCTACTIFTAEAGSELCSECSNPYGITILGISEPITVVDLEAECAAEYENQFQCSFGKRHDWQPVLRNGWRNEPGHFECANCQRTCTVGKGRLGSSAARHRKAYKGPKDAPKALTGGMFTFTPEASLVKIAREAATGPDAHADTRREFAMKFALRKEVARKVGKLAAIGIDVFAL